MATCSADVPTLPILPLDASSAAITLREVTVYTLPFLSVAISGFPIQA